MSKTPKIKGRIYRSRETADLTSIGVGGKADYVFYVYDFESLRKAVKWLRDKKINYLIIGSGTNLIFSDRGYQGALIKLGGVFSRIRLNGNRCYVGAGAVLKNVIEKIVQNGYSGMEPLFGIPGTVGGAVHGNAGAYRREIGDVVERIWVVDQDGEEMMLTRDKIGFQYRSTAINPKLIITLIELSLRRRKVGIKKLKQYEKMRKRRLPWGKSSGCIFKNPNGMSAGQLIEKCGLKGFRIGGAVVSEKHANFIINDSTATFKDIMKLIRIIKKRVKDKGFNLKLEVEVVK